MTDQPSPRAPAPDRADAAATAPAAPAAPRSERRELTWSQVVAGFPRGVWWAVYAVAGLVLLLVLVLVAGVGLARHPLPETGGRAELAGLDAEVEVLRGPHGIPQVYADTDADLMRAQGYVHAQERFWQMDVRRHVASGRLAELVGEEGLASDKVMRTLGLRRVAERELPLLDPDTRDLLYAYAEGVNAYLGSHGSTDIAVQYDLLALTGPGHEPEPWGPVDSLVWFKAMAWEMRGNMHAEIDRATALLDHTPAQVAQLYPDYDGSRHPPIVSGGGVVDGVYEQQASGNATRNPVRPAYSPATVRALHRVGDQVERVPELLGRGRGLGSNSWVVSGEHSASGEPLLANDPHLGTSQPGPWMQMGLHCRTATPDCGLQVSGSTSAGFPGVMIGHNADIAWGMTNLRPDVTDLYLERIRDGRWVRDGRLRPLRVRTETIEVRGGEDFELQVRRTRHGPLLSDVSPRLSTVGANAAGTGADVDLGVAVSWTGLDPRPSADAVLALNRAGDWDEFRAAASALDTPAQNLVYADREGHIGYQATGRIPIRKSGNDGRWPVEGWLPENDWSRDHIPFDGLPNVRDPGAGYITAGNQQVIGGRYPWHLTDDWSRGYRSTRIRRLLERGGELSVDEMAAIQVDDQHPVASELVPHLLEVDGLPEGYYSAGQELLADWDFGQPADGSAAAYYNVVWRNLLAMTFHDDLRRRAWPDGSDRWYAVVSRLLRNPAASWWDDRRTEQVVETRDDVLLRAMKKARDDMTRAQALDADDWTWGHLHRMQLRDPVLGDSGSELVQWVLNREDIEVGGGNGTVHATAWDATAGFDVTTAPSMRMVVSVADWDSSRWVDMTGVSGHPASDHYDDQTEPWLQGDLLPWRFSREAVEEAASDRLVLEPVREE